MGLEMDQQLLRAAVALAAVVAPRHPVADVGAAWGQSGVRSAAADTARRRGLPGPSEAEAASEVGGSEGEGGSAAGGLEAGPAADTAPRLASLCASSSSR